MNIAIILSGGVGSRMGLNTPKQYVRVSNKMIITYSLNTFLRHSEINAVIIGCAEEWKEAIQEDISQIEMSKIIAWAQAGETRQYSIYNALKVAQEVANGQPCNVIIHDAARPLVSDNLITNCIEGCIDSDGVMPVIPVKDTIYQSTDGKSIDALLNRSQLWCGQAPEAFQLKKYLAIHEAMTHEEILQINGSTEIAFRAGLNCKMIEGDPMNFKITTSEDLIAFKNIIANTQ